MHPRRLLPSLLVLSVLVVSNALAEGHQKPSTRADDPDQDRRKVEEDNPEFPQFERKDVVLDYKGLKYNPCNDVLYPTVIRTDRLKNPLGKYYMYYGPHNAPGGICLAYADSLEGPWTEYKTNPVISRIWQPHYTVSHVCSAHALWIPDEKRLFLWYHGENSETRYATTEDGIHFEYGDIAVRGRDFEKGVFNASYSRVFEHNIPGKDNRYIMLVSGCSKKGMSIYLAWSRDARTWTTQKKPIIVPQEGSQFLASPRLLKWNKRLYVICGQTRPMPSKSGRYECDIVASEVDPTFSKVRYAGFFFPAREEEPDSSWVNSPCFVREDGKLYMFYDLGPRLNNRIALAVAPDEE
ncbi:hypothetical protein LCGC14_1945430 [marine sediment metagenome]|uniref:Glycosyl hydrolase family 32 N-terminal domain-containing protein n=1 Tax=marine sediment metagenome TaxID=412755 RepID=A0A0F9FJC6_9ZZZZ